MVFDVSFQGNSSFESYGNIEIGTKRASYDVNIKGKYYCYHFGKRSSKNLLLTALFKNMRILRFKTQLTFAFFAAVNHLSGPVRK